MSSGIETLEVVEPWLYATLSGDLALADLVGTRIVGTLAGGDVEPPYVHFLMVSTRDVLGTGAERHDTDNIYTVKVVTRGASWDQAKPVAKRLDALLGVKGTRTVPGGSLTCTRERTVQYPSVDNGVQHRHLGADWRIRANGLGA